jgi:hypothetical protein
MSSAGHFNTPAQILPKHLKWQEHVVVPEDFSKDEILELKKWSRITGDEDSGYEPVYLSTWNGPRVALTAGVASLLFVMMAT